MTKLAGGNLITKNYKLQPEYMGTRSIRVTVFNVTTDLSGDVLVAFLSSFSKADDMSSIITSSSLIHENYVSKICLKRDGFQTIPDAINYKDRQLIVVIEGKRSHGWSCKQVGNLAILPTKKQRTQPAGVRAQDYSCGKCDRLDTGPQAHQSPEQEEGRKDDSFQ